MTSAEYRPSQPDPHRPEGPASDVPARVPGGYPPPGAYPPPEPAKGSAGRVVALVGGIGALLLAAVGALFYADVSQSRTESSHQSYAAPGTVELVADGDVAVRAADGDVEVEAIARSGLSRPSYSTREEGDRLVVTHECREFWSFPRCSGQLDVTLPAGTEVLVRTSNGDVVAAGIAGTLEVRTSNGDVESSDNPGRQILTSSNGDVVVLGAGGDVSARTSNGDVEAERIAGTLDSGTSNGRTSVVDVDGDLTAESSNGRIDVDGFGGDVSVETSNGDVTVTGDDVPVRLSMSTGNGSETVEGPTDPDADRSVEIETDNGDAAYLGR
ncbi:DUF4097 family beta strand repeat-containing protein [Myceligenerans xiligouense]|uniref:Putative adhesin n=1 Tax=Myceligenerans xiligouense TaxID=253184 RepID=A0A3N4Z7S3_9MICO|nr:DUF4097 family beta strand repeat-containing protein [Myceligenerans xiligouense]RPF21382.1 putative adhesin [Myceligenerans xiligouense]